MDGVNVFHSVIVYNYLIELIWYLLHTDGVDYERTVKRLTFRGSQRQACFLIPLLDDNKGENAKFFYAYLPRVVEGVILAPSAAQIMITDDDGKIM